MQSHSLCLFLVIGFVVSFVRTVPTGPSTESTAATSGDSTVSYQSPKPLSTEHTRKPRCDISFSNHVWCYIWKKLRLHRLFGKCKPLCVLAETNDVANNEAPAVQKTMSTTLTEPGITLQPTTGLEIGTESGTEETPRPTRDTCDDEDDDDVDDDDDDDDCDDDDDDEGKDD
ncbi:hypothetical protein FGIG_03434 [Fasciola gigantica]|uniref:Uncharacterized protein n=1 Tax=Fasciola gigantica TaxID=46835 RepID=A0A504YX67_FASGI|nr:hypothetical protein FGIG_03434 [Fasciola gigantica]